MIVQGLPAQKCQSLEILSSLSHAGFHSPFAFAYVLLHCSLQKLHCQACRTQPSLSHLSHLNPSHRPFCSYQVKYFIFFKFVVFCILFFYHRNQKKKHTCFVTCIVLKAFAKGNVWLDDWL